MLSAGRGTEFVHQGGVAKLSTLASSHAALSQSAHPAEVVWRSGAVAAANICASLCRSDPATREAMVRAGGLEVVLQLVRCDEHDCQVLA